MRILQSAANLAKSVKSADNFCFSFGIPKTVRDHDFPGDT
jgi:hypothetical protein